MIYYRIVYIIIDKIHKKVITRPQIEFYKTDNKHFIKLSNYRKKIKFEQFLFKDQDEFLNFLETQKIKINLFYDYTIYNDIINLAEENKIYKIIIGD